MKKKVFTALMLSTLMLFTLGCQKDIVVTDVNEEVVVIVDEEKDDNSSEMAEEKNVSDKEADVDNKSSENETDEIEEKTQEEIMQEFELIKTKSAKEILIFLDENISSLDTLDADTLLSNFIEKSKQEIEKSNSYLFSEKSLYINDSINKSVVFDGNYSIFADKKKQLLNDLEDVDIKENLTLIFDKGQGLISAEGSYYAVVDYLDLYRKYAKYVSNSLSDYLEIASIETTEPSTVEEYLAISADQLKIRAIRYEDYLKNNSGSPYVGEIRILHLTAIWKIVNPSIFDGQLNDDFTVKEDMLKLYSEVLELSEYPVLLEAVNGTLDFIKSREGGVIGSLEDSNDMIEHARKMQENAANQIDKLYMNR